MEATSQNVGDEQSLQKQRLNFQVAIFKLEDLMKKTDFSQSSLWRKFIEKRLQELGSISQVIEMFSENGHEDGQILEYLIIADYSSSEILGFLDLVGWDCERIAYAILEQLDSGHYWDDPKILEFILSSRVDDLRIFQLLHYSLQLSQDTLIRLKQIGWDERRLLKAIIESGLFNTLSCDLLLEAKNYNSLVFGNEEVIMNIMDDLGLSDKVKADLWRNASKSLGEAIGVLICLNWELERIMLVLSENNINLGDIAAVLLELKIEEAEIIKAFSNLGLSDKDIIFELTKADWTNLKIAECLLAADWSIERIVQAMIATNKNEYFISEIVEEGVRKYQRCQRKDIFGYEYWQGDNIRKWKDVIKTAFQQIGVEPEVP